MLLTSELENVEDLGVPVLKFRYADEAGPITENTRAKFEAARALMPAVESALVATLDREAIWNFETGEVFAHPPLTDEDDLTATHEAIKAGMDVVARSKSTKGASFRYLLTNLVDFSN